MHCEAEPCCWRGRRCAHSVKLHSLLPRIAAGECRRAGVAHWHQECQECHQECPPGNAWCKEGALHQLPCTSFPGRWAHLAPAVLHLKRAVCCSTSSTRTPGLQAARVATSVMCNTPTLPRTHAARCLPCLIQRTCGRATSAPTAWTCAWWVLGMVQLAAAGGCLAATCCSNLYYILVGVC